MCIWIAATAVGVAMTAAQIGVAVWQSEKAEDAQNKAEKNQEKLNQQKRIDAQGANNKRIQQAKREANEIRASLCKDSLGDLFEAKKLKFKDRAITANLARLSEISGKRNYYSNGKAAA